MANNRDHLKYYGQYQDKSFLEWFINQDLSYRFLINRFGSEIRSSASSLFREAVLHQTSTLRKELRKEILMD